MSGVILGLVAALWISRTGASLLFGVSAGDPLTFVTISTFLIPLAVAALFFPARRAMKVEAMTALR